MADTKISALTALTNAELASDDVLPIVDTGATATKKITVAQLFGDTTNGVVYLNGSKVATSGSGLVFDGTNLGVGTSSPNRLLTLSRAVSGVTNFISLAPTTNNASDTYGIEFSNPTWGNKAGIYGVNENFGNGAGALAFYTQTSAFSFAERMRITSAGKVGIGTSSPATQLEVYNATNADQYWRTSAISLYAQANNTNGTALFGTLTNHPLTFWTSSVERLRIDSSGNLGLGVTPSAWWAGSKAIDVNTVGGFVASTGSSLVTLNAYYNGTNWIYKTNGIASYYDQTLGTHAWFTAPSGTAGNAISFTQAMTLTAAGNLGIGTSSPSASAILDAQSTTKGVRMPNMTTAQKNAIASPAAGLMVFDTTLSKLCVYTGAAWETVTSI